MTRAELHERLMEFLERSAWTSPRSCGTVRPRPEQSALTVEQKALLEKRRAAFLADPEACDPMGNIKARVLARLCHGL